MRRVNANYAHLAQTASASVKIIAESIGKWRVPQQRLSEADLLGEWRDPRTGPQSGSRRKLHSNEVS